MWYVGTHRSSVITRIFKWPLRTDGHHLPRRWSPTANPSLWWFIFLLFFCFCLLVFFFDGEDERDYAMGNTVKAFITLCRRYQRGQRETKESPLDDEKCHTACATNKKKTEMRKKNLARIKNWSFFLRPRVFRVTGVTGFFDIIHDRPNRQTRIIIRSSVPVFC